MKITASNFRSVPLFEQHHSSLWRVLTRQGQREQKVARAYSQFLDEVECQSADQRNIDLIGISYIAHQLVENLESSKEKTSLKQRVVALNIRAMLERTEDRETLSYDSFEQQAIDWKRSQEVLDVRALTGDDQNLLSAIYANKEFMILLEDDSFRSDFFNWTLRFGLSGELYAAFPHLCSKLIEAKLHNCLSADQGQFLNVLRSDIGIDVTLRMEGGRDFSLLDDSKRVIFPSGKSLSVGEIFESFRRREIEVTDLRYFPALTINAEGATKQGVCEWQTVDDTIAIASQEGNYWEHLPAYKRLTLEETSAYFGIECNGNDWVIAAAATRTSRKPVLTGHTYAEIAIPSAAGDYYQIYPIGKFPDKYPKNFLDTLKTLFMPFGATLVYPDDNPEYQEREHVRRPILCTPEKGIEVMEWIRKDMLASYDKHVFVFVSHNCATWVKELIQENFPGHPLGSLFDMNLNDLEPEGAMKVIFDAMKKYPTLQPYIIKFFGLLLGGWVSKHEDRGHGAKKISYFSLKPGQRPIQSGYRLFQERAELATP